MWFKKEETKEEKIQSLKRNVEKMLKVVKIDIEQYDMSTALRHIKDVTEVCTHIKDKWETQDCKDIFEHLSNYMDFVKLTNEKDLILSRKLTELKQYLNSI
jgi:predicted metalloendopeptidase